MGAKQWMFCSHVTASRMASFTMLQQAECSSSRNDESEFIPKGYNLATGYDDRSEYRRDCFQRSQDALVLVAVLINGARQTTTALPNGSICAGHSLST